EVVYHFAANPDVRLDRRGTKPTIDENIVATHRVLEACRAASVPRIVFPSTSTVYGEAKVVPTPEDYSPFEPISLYGASKLAGEALLSAYAHSFGVRALVFRLAHVVGPRGGRGPRVDRGRADDAARGRPAETDGMATEEDERAGSARGRTRCMVLDPRAAARVGDNVFIACPGSSEYLGLWGSLVYPSGFGTPHRGRRACDGSSNLPSPTPRGRPKSDMAEGIRWRGNSRPQRGDGIGSWLRVCSTRSG